jgi:hypothetical protein
MFLIALNAFPITGQSLSRRKSMTTNRSPMKSRKNASKKSTELKGFSGLNLLKRYRYKGQYGYIYIMAINDDEALIEAKRSLYRTDQPDVGNLERFNPQSLQYEKAAP